MSHPAFSLFQFKLYIYMLTFLYGYVWFQENLKENVRERKYKRKIEGKKKRRKIKNRLKIDKLFFLLLQTHFIYFNSSI